MARGRGEGGVVGVGGEASSICKYSVGINLKIDFQLAGF